MTDAIGDRRHRNTLFVLRTPKAEFCNSLPGHDLETALDFVRGVEHVHRIVQGFDTPKPGCAVQPSCVETMREQVRLRRLDGLEQTRHSFRDRCHDAPGPAVIVLIAQGVLRQRLAQALVAAGCQADTIRRHMTGRPGASTRRG